jgi:glycosyltransferase involved in cell wall biosynthesis
MKVTVVMETYNHERLIRQAIESVLAQRVSFPYELLIAEDCSTDATRQIVCEYAAKHPGLIRLLLQPRNLGASANFAAALYACRGQYIAFLEGDDYWTAEDKLQRQIDFLDAHPDYVLCGTRAKMVWDDGSREPELFPAVAPASGEFADLVAFNCLSTCTVVMRNGLLGPCRKWFSESLIDYGLWLLTAAHGKFRVLEEPTAVYRRHAGGIWTGRSNLRKLRWMMRVVENVDRDLHYRRHSELRRLLGGLHDQAAVECEQAGDAAGFCRHRLCAVRYRYGAGILAPGSWFERLLGATPLSTCVEVGGPALVALYRHAKGWRRAPALAGNGRVL